MGSFTSKGLELDRSDLRTALGQPPPEGLVPIGDMGIYISPHVKEDKPVSPFDCQNYPDSPYCGGNPWTKTPVGIDLDFTVDECGASVTGTPILGFTKLPPISVAWINPACRKEYDEASRTPSPLPRTPDLNMLPPPDQEAPGGFNENDIVVCFIATERFDQTTTYSTQTQQANTTWNHYVTQLEIIEHPTNRKNDSIAYPNNSVWSQFKGYPSRTNSSAVRTDYLVMPTNWPKSEQRNWWLQNVPPLSLELWKDYQYTWSGALNSAWQNGHLVVGRFGSIFPSRALASGSATYNYQDATSWRVEQVWGVTSVLYCALLSGLPSKSPPRLDKKRKCCMQCCSGSETQERRRDQENAEILRLLREIRRNIGNFPIQANIFDANEDKPGAQARKENITSVAQGLQVGIREGQKALKCIGIDQLPIYVPSSMIEDESNGVLGDIGDLKNKIFKQKIESIAEMQIWRAKNDNEIFGQWQEVITIEDSDPTQKGNQPKKVVLPNMARTFRELVLLNSTQIKVQGLLLDTVLKMYVDLTGTKVSTAVCEAILRDIQDYLDYPTIAKAVDVPVGVTIPSKGDPNDDKEDLERFLRNSIIKAAFDDWTGEGSLTEMLLTLLKAAESTIAQNFDSI